MGKAEEGKVEQGEGEEGTPHPSLAGADCSLKGKTKPPGPPGPAGRSNERSLMAESETRQLHYTCKINGRSPALPIDPTCRMSARPPRGLGADTGLLNMSGAH